MPPTLASDSSKPHGDTHTFFDMPKISGLFEPFHVPVEVFQPIVEKGIVVSDCPQVAEEELHVHCVESNNGDKCSYVDLCHRVAQNKWASTFRKQPLEIIQGCKDCCYGFFIAFLIGRGVRLVDTDAEFRLQPRRNFVD